MRVTLLLLPALLWAQTPAPKPATVVTPKPSAPKASAAAPAVPGAAKPATAKPATAKPATAKPVTARPAARSATAVKPAAPKVMTDDQKIIYALGLSMSRSLAQFNLTPAELEICKQALTDAAAGKPALELDAWGPKIQGLVASRAARTTDKQKADSAAFLAKAAVEANAEKTASGLVYKELTPGTGASPKAEDTVKVHYRGTLIDGTEFDSSYKRNAPAEFPLGNVIKCWTEGVQKMKVGGKSLLVCPSDIAYGDQGRPGIPGGAALVFEIELLEIPGAK
jgi:FKBP-type peptidyl-prolyl cis-trans isomerase FkpA